MYFAPIRDWFHLSIWTIFTLFINTRLSGSVELNEKLADERSLEEWKKNLNLNDETLSKLYQEVNDFLIRRDLDSDNNHLSDTFEVNVPNLDSSIKEDKTESEDLKHLLTKRSVCNGFRDSLSCFRSYLALWRLQRQGLKDPISLRNIGKRAYSFRNVGKRGNTENQFSSDEAEELDANKRDLRFPRSYFRSIGKRSDGFERNTRPSFRSIGKRPSFRSIGKRPSFRSIGKRPSFRSIGKRPSFRSIGKRLSFRNVGKRDDGYNRGIRMSFRNVGKRDNFERDDRRAFRSIGKRDPLFERDDRRGFRSIGKREDGFERDDRMSFRNVGKRDDDDNSLERQTRMGFRSIGKRDPLFERDERMSFRSIGKRDDDFNRDTRMAFRSIGKRHANENVPEGLHKSDDTTL